MRLMLRSVYPLVLCVLLTTQVGTAQSPVSETALSSKPLRVERGSKLILELAQPLSSATARKGQTVRLRLNGNWIVSGHIVLPDGTPVEAIVRRVQRPIPGKVGGRVVITDGSVLLASGKRVKLNIEMPDAEECDDPSPCAALASIMVVIEAPLLVLELPVLLAELPKQITKDHQQKWENDAGPVESNLAAGSVISATTKHRMFVAAM